MLRAVTSWTRRRWLSALGMAAASVILIGVPTDLIPNPVFGREVPPTPWAWPVLVLTSVLGGLLFATYVREGSDGAIDGPGRTGTFGGLLTLFAVGCPVCNKLVLLALGYSGAMQWFAPVQPYLGAAAVVVLAWALRVRLRGEASCPVPAL